MKKQLVMGIFLTLVLASISMIPTSVAYTEEEPLEIILYAGQDIPVGTVSVWNDEDNIHVEYETTEPWVITETHLYVGTTDPAELTSAPGQFPYPQYFDPAVDYYPYVIALDDIDGYHLKLNKNGQPTGAWEADGNPGVGPGDNIFIAAHAVVMDTTCYQTAYLYGLERYTGTVYEIDVLSGISSMVFDITPPPPVGSAKPNGLAYDSVNGRFYYADYQPTTTLYYWDTGQHVAGLVTGEIAGADIYNGGYYYIDSGTDDLYVVSFNADGTISSESKLGDIAADAHGWTFDGDIAINDGVLYGWGHDSHGYEFFTYDLSLGTFTINKPSYQNSLQLAFGSNGILYGHRSGAPGAFYVVDTTTGEPTVVTPLPIPGLLYTDCASGEICEPTYETAWAGIDGEIQFPGDNWATYFIYTQGWDLTGDWIWRVYYGSGTYDHDFTLTVDMGTGTFNGEGGYPASGPPYSIYEKITGTVSDDTITFTSIYYSDPARTIATGYSWWGTGTIAVDGTLSGTWQSSAGQSGNWASISGHATWT